MADLDATMRALRSRTPARFWRESGTGT